MASLDRDTLQDLRNTLEERAQALRNELRDTVRRNDQEKTQLLRDEVRDNGDESFLDLVTDVNLADVDRDLSEFRAVTAALSRMDSGQYGHCQDCGREISLQRLRAQPFAIRCVQCQEQHEHLTNQTRTPTL
jgi:DnaK suppressor protein